jgi:hypothetical protein
MWASLQYVNCLSNRHIHLECQQDRQSAYKVTSSCFRVTIAAVKKKYEVYILSVSVFLLLFCSVLYCHLWHIWLDHIFPHYLINGKILGKK